MKKIISLLLVIVLTAGIAISGTVAYLTMDAGDELNVFTVGDIDVSLDEDVSVNGGTDKVVESEGGAEYTDIMPGDDIQKEVTVTNNGENAAYVRVTVTLNNAYKINSAIDDVYEGKGYSEDAVQAVYDYIFQGWGMNHKKVDDQGNALGMRLTITGEDMPEHTLWVDSTKTMPDYSQNYAGNVYQLAGEEDGFQPGLTAGYYSGNVNGDDAGLMEAYELRYTYYLYLEGGESSTLFEGFNVPAEFDAAQLEMFNGLNIDIHAEAIQADNFSTPKDAFDALVDGAPAIVKEVSTVEELSEAMEEGGYVVLTGDIAVTPETELARGNYIAAIFNDTILDLNGHNISFDLGADKASTNPRMFYVYSADLTIKGEGDLSVTNDAAVAWVTKNGGLYVEGGNYISDNHETGEDNSIFAIFYSSGGEIHVYDGTFTYDNLAGGTNGGFNVQDWWGHKITLYEGVLLSNEVYRQPQDNDALRIRLAEGCYLKEVEIDGQTWYQVTAAGAWDGTVDTSWYNAEKTEFTLNTAEEVAGLSKLVSDGNSFSGKTVKLGLNIDLGGHEWTPIGQTGGYYASAYFMGNFDGQGHTISNMNITQTNDGGNYAAGFFGFLDCGMTSTIENVTFDNAVVNGHHWTGVAAGYLSGNMENVKVTNSTISCTHANDKACGDKVGAVVGHVNGTQGKMTGCSAENCTVSAGRDAGQVVGGAYASQVVDCTVVNVTVTANGTCNDEKNINNEVIGRVLG